MTRLDAHVTETTGTCVADVGPVVRLFEAREVPLGGVRGSTVHRTLPQRELPLVGAWCFLDRFDDEKVGMRVLPHPHIGLQTVTWPVAGDVHHRDSVGSDVVVRPRQLNIMTAGRGIAHSEISLGAAGSPLRGLQLWTALPEHALGTAPFFEQHTELPRYRAPGLEATVFLGRLGDTVSPATTFSPLLGADVTLDPGATATLRLDPGFEHAVLVLDGVLDVDGAPEDGGTRLVSGPLLYLGTRRESLTFSSPGGGQGTGGQRVDGQGTRFVLLGGTPFEEQIVMWWNFVGRSHEEIAAAREDWETRSDRFGTVAGHGSQRIPAPPLPGVRLTPRRRGVHG